MTTQIKTPTSTLSTENGKISIPIYVGISNDAARRVLEVLRRKIQHAEPDERSSSLGGVKVQTNTLTNTQREIENRLRVDLQTLRFVLFDSMGRGVSLDLALRIQHELGDEFTLVSKKDLDAAWKNSLASYDYHAKTH